MNRSPDRLVAYLRRNRPARWGVSALSGLLILGAVGLVGYPFFTNLYQTHLQSRLAHQLSSDSSLARQFRRDRVPVGTSLTRLVIPAIGVDVVVVEGTSEPALMAGAGHYASTPLPCQAGNVAIAGHRTTYGRPFSNVNRLVPGDKILFDTPVGTCTYEVYREPFLVLPTDTSIVANTPGEYKLTLTSCAPKGSASHRIVIKAEMVGGPTSA